MLPQASIADHYTSASDRRSGVRARGRRLAALLGLWAAMALVWGAVLPRVASQPAIDRRLRDLEARGIDPSAMFYSELPLMSDVTGQLDQIHRRRPDPLWQR